MARKLKNGEMKVAIHRKGIGYEAPMVVAEITDDCIYSGFFGVIDSERMKRINDRISELLARTEIKVIVIDLSNVDIIDSAVAVHLIKLGNILTNVGAQVIFCGIQMMVSQTMVNAGVDLSNFRISRDLKSALKEVFLIQGIELRKVTDMK